MVSGFEGFKDGESFEGRGPVGHQGGGGGELHHPARVQHQHLQASPHSTSLVVTNSVSLTPPWRPPPTHPVAVHDCVEPVGDGEHGAGGELGPGGGGGGGGGGSGGGIGGLW